MTSGRMFSHREASCSKATACGRQPHIHSRPLGQSWRSQSRCGSAGRSATRELLPCSRQHARRSRGIICLNAVSDAAATNNLSAADSAVAGDTAAADAAAVMPVQQIRLRVQVITSMDKVDAEEWDRCATGGGEVNPFTLHAFLHALEVTGCAVKEEGWLPQHVLVRDEDTGELLGAVPLYLKSHSYGEYVFDNSWASSYHRTGQSYYPKLQSCVPFTPASGARILLAPSVAAPAVRRALANSLKTITDELGVSSLHMTFTQPVEAQELQQLGYLRRTGIQYHWENRGYKTFEDFLAALRQSKRKNIRQERKKVAASGLTLKRLSGADLRPRHWDSFYEFYRNTTDRKWGQAYLTRGFFHMLGETMPEHVMLAAAQDGDQLVAGALNLVGSHAIYGRNWGCAYGTQISGLHFECCYYMESSLFPCSPPAIEEAIERGLPRVEAGAQGEHKIQRGYLPSLTHSVHYIRDPEFKMAVQQFLRRETHNIDFTLEALTNEASPYKSLT